MCNVMSQFNFLLSKAQRNALAEERHSAQLMAEQEKQQNSAMAKNREIFQRNLKGRVGVFYSTHWGKEILTENPYRNP